MKTKNILDRFSSVPMLIDIGFGLNAIESYLFGLESNESYKQVIKERDESSLPQVFSISSDVAEFSGNALNTNIKSVAVLQLKGTMISEGGLCTQSIDVLVNQIDAATANPNIVGVVLNTHSGGGEVVAAQRLSNAITHLKQVKPIIQYVDGMSASGAYWAGSHCDEIICGGNTTQVGSIGVVIQFDKRAIEEIKENLVSIYADGSNNKHDIFKAIITGDHEYVRDKSLNPTRKEFVRVVKAGHPDISEDALTGSMYQAKEAKKLKMIDSIGTKYDAINRVVQLSRKRNRISNAKQFLNK